MLNTTKRRYDVLLYTIFRMLEISAVQTVRKYQWGGFVEMEVPLILGKIIAVVSAKLISRKRTVYNTTKCI